MTVLLIIKDCDRQYSCNNFSFGCYQTYGFYQVTDKCYQMYGFYQHYLTSNIFDF